MSKLTIRLNQHTPLIHFQSDQEGATIRATEFKPKLDKFLIEHAFPGGFEEYKQYLIGYKKFKTEEDFKDKKAFDYKIRFCNVVRWRQADIPKNFPFYFNNIDKNNADTNKFVFCDSVDVKFFSFNTKLLNTIEKWMGKFLLLTNFGFRQNKGFGSFYVSDSENVFHDADENFKYKIIMKNLNGKKEIDFYKNLFNQLNNLYKNIRSNESKGTPYIKEYFYDINMIWDKQVIRDKFLYHKDLSIPNAYLIKDLLGLSLIEKWNWGNGKQAFNVKKEHIDKEHKIERMESPIFFKPLRYNNSFNVYVDIKEIPIEFFDQKFEISKCIERNHQLETLDRLELLTPKEFNVNTFLEYIAGKDCRIKKC
ncbi:hypothetical protein KQI89_16305 [Clostridium sp. MSJ-4]|uniref:Uncharacterized protein n=1 Tax=Clostridium simiarum TaxID=2841506 RepID=A0ABS6F4X4_9CLOT|nr:hypothetical protein [Clostridium simiarum]MBU5593313.1 hypothetical protein [Clostridium simiarum]